MNIKNLGIAGGAALAGSAVLAVSVVGGGAIGAFAPSITNEKASSQAVAPAFTQSEKGVDYNGSAGTTDLLATSAITADGRGTAISAAALPYLPAKMIPGNEAAGVFTFENTGTVGGAFTLSLVDSSVVEDAAALALIEVTVDIDADNDGVFETTLPAKTLGALASSPFVIDADLAAAEKVGVKVSGEHIGTGAVVETGKEIKDVDFKYTLTVL
jgi:hypothetical protein